MERLLKLICALCCLGLVISCDENLMDSGTKSFSSAEWSQDSPATFDIKPPDSITDYNIYLRLRNNQDYAYKNLWMITQMKFPQGKIVIDTLEYNMADAQGKFEGTGHDVIENKLGYLKGFRFRESGTYQLSLQQAMRKSGSAIPLEQLSGVLDVGYSIEKQLQDGNK